MSDMVLNAATRAYQKYLQTLQPGHTKNTSKTAAAKGFDESRFRFGDFRTNLKKASSSSEIKSNKSSTVNKSSAANRNPAINEAASDLRKASVPNMSLDEYKAYIRQKIYALPVNDTRVLDSVAVDITDEGFLAMQKDPEYEEWVLGTLKVDFAMTDPFSGISGGRYIVHRFGATKEEYSAESWPLSESGGMGQSIFNANAKKSFWQRRTDSIQSYLEAQNLMNLQQRRLDRVSNGYSTGTYSTNILQDYLRRLYYANYNTDVK